MANSSIVRRSPPPMDSRHSFSPPMSNNQPTAWQPPPPTPSLLSIGHFVRLMTGGPDREWPSLSVDGRRMALELDRPTASETVIHSASCCCCCIVHSPEPISTTYPPLTYSQKSENSPHLPHCFRLPSGANILPIHPGRCRSRIVSFPSCFLRLGSNSDSPFSSSLILKSAEASSSE